MVERWGQQPQSKETGCDANWSKRMEKRQRPTDQNGKEYEKEHNIGNKQEKGASICMCVQKGVTLLHSTN